MNEMAWLKYLRSTGICVLLVLVVGSLSPASTADNGDRPDVDTDAQRHGHGHEGHPTQRKHLRGAAERRVHVNCPMFHCDRQRTGWNPHETVLTPADVSSGRFGKLWQTTLDAVTIGGTSYDPHLYASPLYVDDLRVTDGGSYEGHHFRAVIAATGNGYVYAINAFDANGVAGGTILWKTSYLFFTGSTKQSDGSSVSVPPSLARVRIVTSPGQPAFLQRDTYENTLIFKNPGTPMVTSNGANHPIIWVLEPNVYRSASLVGSGVHPQLHAIDGTTMQVLFSSDPNDPDMHQGRKYNHPVVARGVVFTGTDRITAWGLRH